jgi:hypothetical protein
VRLNLEIHQIDIKGAYLNGQLNDKRTHFMCQPPWLSLPNSTGKVLRLKKALYSLKQSGHR